MNDSRRGVTAGGVMIALLLVLCVALLVAALWMNLTQPEEIEAGATLSAQEQSELLGEAAQAGIGMPNADKYYHRPVLIAADSVQSGVSAAVWSGLCDYLGAPERPEALYEAADTASSLTQAIEQAETDIVPNLILLTGEQAPQAAVQAQQTYVGTFFAVFDGAMDAPAANACCITFATEEAGFLAGYAAVMEGYTQLCFAAEEETDEAALYRTGFVQGADRAAQILDVEVRLSCSTGAPVFDETAQVAFVCGSTAFQENAVYEAEQAEKKIICSGLDYSYLYKSRPVQASPILASAAKNYAAVTQSLLVSVDSGAWSQFYGGKTLRYDLSWGDTVSLSNSQFGWQFTRFTAEQYYQLLANLRNDPNYAVSADPPTPSGHLRLDEGGEA